MCCVNVCCVSVCWCVQACCVCCVSGCWCMLCECVLLCNRPVVCVCVSSERPQPPLRLSVPQAQMQSRQLQLDWVPGGDGSSPVRYFTLQTRELPDGDWITHSSAIGHNCTSWDVNRWVRARDPWSTRSIAQTEGNIGTTDKLAIALQWRSA